MPSLYMNSVSFAREENRPVCPTREIIPGFPTARVPKPLIIPGFPKDRHVPEAPMGVWSGPLMAGGQETATG